MCVCVCVVCVCVRVVSYLICVKLNVLYRLRFMEQDHLLNDVHLALNVDGLVEPAVI